MALTERSHGVRLQMHKLTRKGSVLETCESWEGNHTGYAKIVFDGEKYRFYYRGGGKNENETFCLECVAYSYYLLCIPIWTDRAFRTFHGRER